MTSATGRQDAQRSEGGSPTPRAGETTRTVERAVEIAAPAAAVWRALTEPGELVRWFPLDARVTPGTGGSIRMLWEDQYDYETPIDVWEPERRLRLVIPGTASAIDFFLEARGGRTALRVVHSGFGGGSQWDAELDANSRGWRFELAALRFYLERHPGEDRQVVWARVLSDIPAAERWRRLVGPGGFLDVAGGAAPGRGISAELPEGGALEGRLLTFEPPRELAAETTAPASGMLRLNVDDLPLRGVSDVHVWLSAYGIPASHVLDLRRAWTDRLLELLPGARLPETREVGWHAERAEGVS